MLIIRIIEHWTRFEYGTYMSVPYLTLGPFEFQKYIFYGVRFRFTWRPESYG